MDRKQFDKLYDPHALEQRIYQHWEAAGYFAPRGTGPAYCIMIPPPNVTGSLHMGHAFQDTLMDALIRYHRMRGDNTLWQAGTDHAGIATQMVVERTLEAEGKRRHDLGREAFLQRVWKWKAQSGGRISEQLRRMGASLDWSRERFTMDEGLSRAVTEVFVRLHEEGLIYRGKRLVNWDPVLHTAVSDLEVISEEEDGQLWHIRYPLANGNGYLVVATTRPETMLGDTAVAVHPGDARYRHLVGQQVELPLSGRKIPIIADDYVDPEFGTGCLKITPAHDFNDYEVGQRHGLPLLNIFAPDARIELPGSPYHGLDRFAARKKIVADLQAANLLEKAEPYKLMIPRGDRTGAVIEPYLTDQWYVRVGPLAKPAIAAVEKGDIRFIPENWARTYFDWMYNIQDWCISRQIWWGHQIPAWYCTDCDGDAIQIHGLQGLRTSTGVAIDGGSARWLRDRLKIPLSQAVTTATAIHVADSASPIVASRKPARCPRCGGTDLVQDPDVLDTWFSSALWPFSTLGWPAQTPELHTFYPTSVLVTGFDIIFFWVARMIMMGLQFMGDVPFREVYVHGLVRDAEGQKMSKSKGNILDPLDLIDGIELEALVEKRTTGLMQPQLAKKIEAATRKQFPDGIPAYGTDALRFTFASLATQGRDIRFDTGRIQGYRNFCNKLWNAARYVLMNTEGRDCGQEGGEVSLTDADRWIISRLQQVETQVESAIREYRFDLMANALYGFIWDEYCSWYLELSKVTLTSSVTAPQTARGTRRTLVRVLEALLRLLHPIMPFITEAIWQEIAPLAGKRGDTIMRQPYPQTELGKIDDVAMGQINWVMAVTAGVRNIRGEMDIAPGKRLRAFLRDGNHDDRKRFQETTPYVVALANLESLDWLEPTAPVEESATALVGNMKVLVPLGALIDKRAEEQRLLKERERTQANLDRARHKLANPNFRARAPQEIVTQEEQRVSELEAATRELDKQLARIRRLPD